MTIFFLYSEEKLLQSLIKLFWWSEVATYSIHIRFSLVV